MKTKLKYEKLRHEFVEFIPKELSDGVIYISVQYATASHRCCCGCGSEVVTPITPTDWKLVFNGLSVTLSPSIGNWSLPCKSHYWITENKVEWASKWSQSRIESGRTADKSAKDRFYKETESSSEHTPKPKPTKKKSSWLSGAKRLLKK